jgi:hypothetical protein
MNTDEIEVRLTRDDLARVLIALAAAARLTRNQDDITAVRGIMLKLVEAAQ